MLSINLGNQSSTTLITSITATPRWEVRVNNEVHRHGIHGCLLPSEGNVEIVHIVVLFSPVTSLGSGCSSFHVTDVSDSKLLSLGQLHLPIDVRQDHALLVV